MIAGKPDDVVEAITRLHDGVDRTPAPAREVANFGDVRTIRLQRRDIHRLWSDSRVASLKAARAVELERPWPVSPNRRNPTFTKRRHPRNLRETGRGVVVGILDWGFDFAHPAFRNADGSSRILALWDQRSFDSKRPAAGVVPAPYGYGRVFFRPDIDAALRTSAPYDQLGYHPGEADRGGGAHGTHVADIAAGTPRPDSPGGVAPGADLIFIHLAAGPILDLADLGSSVRILEAIDFLRRVSQGRPLAINASIGRHGGSHVGRNLVERAFDNFVEGRNNTEIVQSAGNYYLAASHASGTLKPGSIRELGWRVARSDMTDNELEIWYSNRDRLILALFPPGGVQPIIARLNETRILYDRAGQEIGRIYHRAFDPNSPDHHIDVFLYRKAPAGQWRVQIHGDRVRDGRFHAWIERDPAGRRGQSRFALRDIDRHCTIGSICTGFNTIAVGPAEILGPFVGPARFGSAGPTRDGRTKPDVVAPGIRERAARSVPESETTPASMNTSMSGASQASPYVAGTVALCLEAGQGQLDFNDIRRAVIGTARQPPTLRPSDALRMGAGLVDVNSAVRIARKIGQARTHQMENAS